MSEGRQEQPHLPISLFDYELPSELIAQHPLEQRSDSRLLVVERQSGQLTHSRFGEIGKWLRAGDLLVLNDTRVFPARLLAQRSTGGRAEFLLLEQTGEEEWIAMARPARRLKPGESLTLLDRDENRTEVKIAVGDRRDDGTLLVTLPASTETLERLGRVPLPHYITESLNDPDRYQTVFAEHSGSVAAPTAGLHFTDEVLDDLVRQGIEIARVTLHVGPGTFQPVKTDDAAQHQMHFERYHVSTEALDQIRRACVEQRRVIAVGSTSCRTLESIADRLVEEGPLSGSTQLYITPGFQFKLVSGLLTNFHLPRSTLLILVSAFAGRELVLRAYSEAIARRYRFYSFGDAMLLV